MIASKITFRFLIFMAIFSMAIFFAGLNETTRLFSFDLAEDNLINQSFLGNETWNDYEEFKGTYIFTNEPFIQFLNYFGLVGLLYLFYFAWIEGRKAPPMDTIQIFSAYNIILILLAYFAIIIFNYLTNVLVDQLILVLFEEIYNATYMYQLFIDWWVGLLLFAYLLSWMANELKYFDLKKSG